jgi:hypothetical protein
MPIDETTIHHLTPNGWITGVEPPDRVESWRRTVTPEQGVKWRCEWVDLSKPTDERDALRRKHEAFMTGSGHPP